MKKYIFFFTMACIAFLFSNDTVQAQQYKIRQVNSLMGMKTESTIYVKGMRKRTEAGAMMGMPAPPVTIEQCDLKRTIKLNDKKKLYFIIPFNEEPEEVVEENEKPAPPPPVKPKEKTTPQKGGIIYRWYTITDTGERKKMYGFTARHVWTYEKIKPSPDACNMKDSMLTTTDGWYIDLPLFNCPTQYRPQKPPSQPNERIKPDCMDRFVNKRSGKGRLGFPLEETRTMKMGSGNAQTSEFKISVGTLELTTSKLDSMLFEIPPGYTEAATEDELQDKLDMKDMMRQIKEQAKNNTSPVTTDDQKAPGKIRIGVYEPKGDEQIQAPSVQQHIVSTLMDGNIEAVAIASEEEAKKFNCDYTLSTDFTKIKSGSKVGGLLKVIKNADPNAASSFNIDATLTLVKLVDGTTTSQPKVSGKYEGKADEAASKAMDEGCRQVLKAIRQ